jgi:exonuclease VII small subunit
MNDVVELYEKANDLAKAGKTEEAIAEYKTGIAIKSRLRVCSDLSATARKAKNFLC